MKVSYLDRARRAAAMLSAFVLAACADRIPVEPGYTSSELLRLDGGRGEFHRYVAIGTSISMGVVSDGVNEQSQRNTWPAQLSQLAGREISLPLIQMPGCGAPLAAPLASGLRINGEGAGQPADTRCCSSHVGGGYRTTDYGAVGGCSS